MAKKKKKAIQRIVLGEGHPWYSASRSAGNLYDCVQLTEKPVAESILLRGGETTVPFEYGDTGNYNRVRLVLEVLE